MTSSAPLVTWRLALLVFVGGVMGTALRILATALVVGEAGLLVVNVVGAFLLGVLTARLGRLNHPRRRELQLTIGVGALGAFTTYSALAVQAADPASLLWALATVVVGSLAAWAGIAAGRAGRAGSTADTEADA